jgi:ubiquinone/menaquinone biosynthesis C-methylase UbiE
LGRRQSPAFICSCPPRRRFPLAQAIHRRDPSLETAGYLANVGLMTGDRTRTDPIGRQAYSRFADRYAALAPTKPHNALCERPATMSLLGEVNGLRVLDAACGPGICCELLAHRGAAVHGFDVTPEMVDLARKRCAGLPVEVTLGDLAHPFHWLSDQSFDKVLCALALDYVETLEPVFREFLRVTRPNGVLVFSMVHPMRDWLDERTHNGRTYFDTVCFGIHWSGFGEPKPFVESYRRPLGVIFNALSDSGWKLDRVLEPRPLSEMRAIAERLHTELSRSPAFICIKARR